MSQSAHSSGATDDENGGDMSLSIQSSDAAGAASEPAEVVQQHQHETQRSMSAMRIGPSYHPIFDKFGAGHVTQFLDNRQQQRNNEHQLRVMDRQYRMGYTLIGVVVFGAAFGGLSWALLPEQAELYFDILSYFGTLVAGGFGGYGIKSWRDQRGN